MTKETMELMQAIIDGESKKDVELKEVGMVAYNKLIVYPHIDMNEYISETPVYVKSKWSE